MGLKGGQSEVAAMPTGGEHPLAEREDVAPRSEVTIDKALDVAGIVWSPSMLLEGESLKSLR